ncbi:MAG: hypothetical protein ACK470_24805, partial [Pseudanabaena sp.]
IIDPQKIATGSVRRYFFVLYGSFFFSYSHFENCFLKAIRRLAFKKQFGAFHRLRCGKASNCFS